MRPVCGNSLSRAGARLCVSGHGQPPRGDFTVKKRADLRALGQNWKKVTWHLRLLLGLPELYVTFDSFCTVVAH